MTVSVESRETLGYVRTFTLPFPRPNQSPTNRERRHIMRGSEFVALRVQLEEELKAWALATHTVERLRARGIYDSPRVGPAAESKRKATQRAGELEGELAAVERHLEGVSEYLQNDYVLLPRHVCSQGNALYRAPATGAGE